MKEEEGSLQGWENDEDWESLHNKEKGREIVAVCHMDLDQDKASQLIFYVSHFKTMISFISSFYH